MSLLKLPNELLFRIATLLPPKQFIALKLTCKECNQRISLSMPLLVKKFRLFLRKKVPHYIFVETIFKEPLFSPQAISSHMPDFDPISEAASHFELSLVKALEAFGFVPLYRDVALVAAAYHADKAYLEKLLQWSIPWQSRQKALHGSFVQACSSGNVQVLEIILAQEGVKVQHNNNIGLRLASEYGHLEVIKVLLSRGANAHALHDAPLCIASGGGHKKVVEYFLSRKDDRQRPIEYAHIDHALHRAVANLHLDIVELLLDAGADVHSEEEYALRMAASPSECRPNSEAMVRLLIRRGADIHSHDEFALRWASGKGHLGIVKILVEHNADVQAHENHALFWASGNGHVEVVRYLLECGADVHANGEYALRWASGCEQHEVVELLRKYGAKARSAGHEEDEIGAHFASLSLK